MTDPADEPFLLEAVRLAQENTPMALDGEHPYEIWRRLHAGA